MSEEELMKQMMGRGSSLLGKKKKRSRSIISCRLYEMYDKIDDFFDLLEMI